MAVVLPITRSRARAKTDGGAMFAHAALSPQSASTLQASQHTSTRRSFEVRLGQIMEYQLMLPAGYDPVVPIPFLLSVSGTGQQHVNGFSQRLVNDSWAVVVALRPDGAPLLFEGAGREGDGVRYKHQLCQHLLHSFAVETGRLLLAGVSNGGISVLRFATLWPQLCRGVVVATGHLSGVASDDELARLQGLPIDMYVGTLDEVGMCPPMRELEAKLTKLGQKPLPQLTVFEGAGHCCSPLIDTRLLFGKIRLMLTHSSGNEFASIKLDGTRDNLSRLPSEQVHAHLVAFSHRLGLSVRDEATRCEADERQGIKRRTRPVTFSPGVHSDDSDSRDEHTDRFQLMEPADVKGRSKSVDVRALRGTSKRQTVADLGVVSSANMQTPNEVSAKTPTQRARIAAIPRNRAASTADNAYPAAGGACSPSVHHARLPWCSESMGHACGSPKSASASPVAQPVLRRPRCQTMTSPHSLASLAEAPEAMRQQRRHQTVQFGALVQAVSTPHGRSQVLVVR